MNREKKIEYYFYLMILRDGTQLPWIKIHNTGISEILEKLSTLELRESKNVAKLIKSIQNATESFYYYHFNLTLEIGHNVTTIFEDSADSSPFVIETPDLVNLMEGWYEFLLAYENNEIPGILHSEKRDEV